MKVKVWVNTEIVRIDGVRNRVHALPCNHPTKKAAATMLAQLKKEHTDSDWSKGTGWTISGGAAAQD